MTTNRMKLSDYVASFLAERGLKHAFIITGGASLHILQSLDDHPDIDPVCPHHEQAAAMSADAYARVTGNFGCAIGTSGPGATNLITGIAGAWFDSVATLFITGQVATYRMKGATPIRQMGFQETDILPMVAPITKYAVQIKDPSQIAFELEKAVHIALSGRPGPVVIDLPDDLQRSLIVPDALPRFDPDAEQETAAPIDAAVLDAVLAMLEEAERPVLILGWGIRLASATAEAGALIRAFQVPVLTSWGAKDLMAEDDPLLVGTFGTHGVRAGNFAMQNADVVIAIGARLSTHETGTPMTDWARGAKVAVVDIDQGELDKFAAFGKTLELGIRADAGDFIEALLHRHKTGRDFARTAWQGRISGWKRNYPACPDTSSSGGSVNPYVFVRELGATLPDDEHIFIDTGCAIAWMMQAFPVRGSQRLYHDFNNTAMGWALPAAVGGSLALGNKPVSCVVGDGSLMMNLQELATVQRHDLPIRIFLLNNNGYSMVQQTQEQWLGGNYAGTSYEGGLGFPDFAKLSDAFSIPYRLIETSAALRSILGDAMTVSGPVLIDVRIPSTERVVPQSKFGYPIEDSEPLLPRDEFLANMIVAPLARSLADA